MLRVRWLGYLDKGSSHEKAQRNQGAEPALTLRTLIPLRFIMATATAALSLNLP